jgi:hypothetical protein
LSGGYEGTASEAANVTRETDTGQKRNDHSGNETDDQCSAKPLSLVRGRLMTKHQHQGSGKQSVNRAGRADGDTRGRYTKEASTTYKTLKRGPPQTTCCGTSAPHRPAPDHGVTF